MKKLASFLKGLWRDQRGLTATPENGLWLVIGLGAAALGAFALVGALRGKFGGLTNALNNLKAISTPITSSTTSTVTLGTADSQTGIISSATGN